MTDVSGPRYFRDQTAPPSMDPGAGFAWAWNGSQWVRSAAAFNRQQPAAGASGGAVVGGGAAPTRGQPATPAAGQSLNLRDPNQRPSTPTGIPNTAWAWNGTQWVRSEAAFRREQQQSAGGAGGSDPNVPIPGNTPMAGGTPQMSPQSARQVIRGFLSRWGLEGLEDLLYNELVGENDFSETRMMIRIRETPEYARRFPGMAMRREAGLVAISEEDYLDDERAYRQLMQSAGLPSGFYDSPDDFARFIGRDVSPEEVGRRIQQGYQAVAQADPSVLATMRQFYGVTDGELAAYMLDPTRAESVILQQVATSQIGAAAARQGFGQAADRAAAERFQRLGVTTSEATEAFGVLARSRELLNPIERGETALDVTETALGLTGRGGAEAAQRLATQQRRRLARFEGGGRFATQGAEVTGLRTT